MALKIIERPVFTATVAVHTANVQGEFEVQYYGYSTSALQAIEQAAAKAGKDVQNEVLYAVVAGFEPVPLPTGQVLRFDPIAPARSIDALADWPGIAPAMLRRYYSALWEERQGNFERLPDGASTPEAQPLLTLPTTTELQPR